MAGDWIKMRIDLIDDPTVASMSAALKLDQFAVIGRLHKLWSWADRHASNGATSGVDPSWIDRYVCKKGFAAAMIKDGWMKFDQETRVLSFPNFDRHNGESSKNRCDAAIRQRKSRERKSGETNGGGARVSIPAPFRRAVFKRDAYQCVFCGQQSSAEREEGKKSILSVDHIAPHSRTDGRQAVEDLATCCIDCNREKNDRTPEEWGMIPGEFLQSGLVYSGHTIVTEKRDNIVTDVTKIPGPEKRREEKSITILPSPPAPADPRHYEICQQWGAAFTKAFRIDYRFDAKDATTLKRFLKGSNDSASEFLSVASKAWDRSRNSAFAKRCKEAATIHGLCTFYNEIRVELQTQTATPDKSVAGFAR